MTLACIACNQPLKPAGNRALLCTCRGEAESGDLTCPEQHYVCETCRVTTSTSLILRTCIASTAREPSALADLLMKHPTKDRAGPGHRLIVAAVLFAPWRNAGLPGISKANLGLALRHASRPPLDACASSWICHLPNLEA